MRHNLYLLLALFSLAIIGCSSEYNDYDDWSSFDKFKELDTSGKHIDCEKLISTTITRSGAGYGDSDWLHDIYDYLQEGYEFKQCEREITASINSYCESITFTSIDSYVNKAPYLSRTYEDTCKFYIEKSLSLLNDTYTLPTSNNAYIVLERHGVMIKPNQIEGISFDEVIKSAWWRIHINTKSRSFRLYYGNQDLWDKAKKDMSQVSSYIEEKN